MELKDFGLEPNTKYNGTLKVVKNDGDNTYYPVTRTTGKILFYKDWDGKERRLFPKKVDHVVKNEKEETGEEGTEEVEETEKDEGEGGNFDAEFLREKAQEETFLFSNEENPFFGNDFTWATTTDFVRDNDTMFE